MDDKVLKVNSLILRIAKGGKDALDVLFAEFGGLLLAMAKKYVWDKAKAEDVVSEVLLRLVRSAKNFKDKHNGLNWLFKSIKNEAINVNKRDGRQAADNIDDHLDIRGVLDISVQITDRLALAQALEHLNPLERRALYLKFWEGLTVREIAKVMKLARSTTQDIIGGALKKLENDLK